MSEQPAREDRERRGRRERALIAAAEPAARAVDRRWVPGTSIYLEEFDTL